MSPELGAVMRVRGNASHLFRLSKFSCARAQHRFCRVIRRRHATPRKTYGVELPEKSVYVQRRGAAGAQHTTVEVRAKGASDAAVLARLFRTIK